MGRTRRGFTIVELMMVIGILAVLVTIITTVSAGAIRQARERKADAVVALVQSGIDTYYAQYGEWPDFTPPTRGNNKIRHPDNPSEWDENRYLLEENESNKIVQRIVRVSVKDKNPMLDVSGLFVARKGSSYGMDLPTAVKGTKQSPKKLKNIAEMVFGYPDRETGRFRPFKMIYTIPTDKLTVSKQ